MTKMLHRLFARAATIGGMAWILSSAAGMAQESNASLHSQIDLLKDQMSQMQQKLEALHEGLRRPCSESGVHTPDRCALSMCKA
jgi:hypothetical protein